MERTDLICFKCKHFKKYIGCVAFNGNIPNVIMETNKHDKPLLDQENDLVFEPADEPID